MKQEPKKKQWKYNSIVKDLHTNKYRQRIKPSKQKDGEDTLNDMLEEYYEDIEDVKN
tara:strand:+ start:1931 stop:2101 length:171 start_codon:yes stop_codon:yes gene_type:complete